MKKEKKYDYANVERTADVEYKYAMAAVAGYIAIHLGFLDIGGGDTWIIVTTALSAYIWWSFRAYFVQVNDNSTAKWLLLIIGMYLLIGFASLSLRVTTSIYYNLPTNDFIIGIFYFLFGLVALSLLAFIAICFKIIFANRHHTFPLKRIAISAMLFIPFYILFILMTNIQFVGEIKDIVDALPKADSAVVIDGVSYTYFEREFMKPPDFSGFFSGVASGISFVWNLFMMIPYYFLFFHFYKADRANKYLVENETF